MTCFIHIIRLKRIESEIQRSLYRVDNSINSNRIAETERFLQHLTAWKENIPHHSRELDGNRRTDTYVSRLSWGALGIRSLTDKQMVSYYKSIRLLLQPQLYEAIINKRHLELCIEACSGICERYRRLHDHLPVAFLTLSLQTIFLAGKHNWRIVTSGGWLKMQGWLLFTASGYPQAARQSNIWVPWATAASCCM